jgi:hypothetical protein
MADPSGRDIMLAAAAKVNSVNCRPGMVDGNGNSAVPSSDGPSSILRSAAAKLTARSGENYRYAEGHSAGSGSIMADAAVWANAHPRPVHHEGGRTSSAIAHQHQGASE